MDHAALHRAFAGRKVLVTGHTGFKGGWLCLWLKQLGAEVTGIALAPLAGPALFDAVQLDQLIDHRIGDIRSPEAFARAAQGVDAEIVFHLAAQALVRPSYQSPVDTYLTNVVGTAVVLDAVRAMPSARAAIVVTSDKCYENSEWVWPYRESDPMGGSDPYSSSKGCTELVASAYRRSYFADPKACRIATVRAGNVFGGGDWAVDRLVPDIVRAAIAGEPVTIRNPASVRPWQHVLEPLSGYLTLAARLLEDGSNSLATGWNFGPEPAAFIDVETIARSLIEAWGSGAPEIAFGKRSDDPHEAGMLTLDSSKARIELGWRPLLAPREAVALTSAWYRAFAQGGTDMRAFTQSQIAAYCGADKIVPFNSKQASCG
jgi:CDP-glucose 4,6-dehydratase